MPPTISAPARRAPFALLTTATLAAGSLVLAPTAQAAEPDATTSAAYLATQLAAGGDRLSVTYGEDSYDDIGVTIDAILAIQSTQTAETQAAASTQYVLDNAGSYTGTGFGELYVGAAGKLLTLTASRGLPGTVGGTDYVAALQAQEQPSGQFQDRSGYGDYSNTLGQSFALIGLKRHGVNPSTAAVDFLLSRQCTDGGFALESSGTCASDPDATSIVVQALATVGGQDAAIGKAADYLESQQGAGGGVKGGTTTRDENANSTGLAAVAFRLAGRTDALAKARGFLDSVRLGCESPRVAGGLAYTAAERSAAGAGTEPSDQINRSTAQALLGSTEFSYGDVSNAGAAAAPATLDCAPATDDPTTEPTGPTAEPTDEPTATPTEEPTSAPDEPVRPAVVQTDGGDLTAAAPLAPAGAALLLLGGAGALGLRLAQRR